jgi:hypothetical protein
VIRICRPLSRGVSLLALSAIVTLAGCGSGSTQVRLLNAMDGQSSVNMLLNSTAVASSVTFGTASGYASSGSGSQTLQIQASNATLINQSITLSGGNNNTVLATDSGATVFTDNKSTPSSGDIQIRVINASFGLGAADVYIVAPGTDISTVNPTVSALGYQAASGYQTVAAGSWEIEFTFAGTKQVEIDSGSQSFSSGEIRTVVGLDGENGSGYSTAVLSDLN